MNNESQPILTHERNLLTFWEEANRTALAVIRLGAYYSTRCFSFVSAHRGQIRSHLRSETRLP